MLPVVLLFALLAPPQQPSASLLQNGLLALKQGRAAEARTLLEDASRQEPNNAYIWLSLAQTYRTLGEQKLAGDAAHKTETLAPNDPIACHGLSLFYTETGEYRRAGELELKFAESARADQAALSRAANLLLRGQDFNGAAEAANKGLQAKASDPQLLLTLGVARYGQRRFDEAITTFLKVAEIDPAVPQPYIFLGKLLDQAGAHLPAVQAADEQWLKQNPQNATASVELAKTLLAAAGDEKRAEELLRSAIALQPDNAEAHYQLGVLFERKRQWQEAADELTRSTSLEPNNPMPHYHLARVYDRLGQHDRAQAERSLHAQLTAPAKQP